MTQITIAVFDLEEKAKQAVLDSGGRVQVATTVCNAAPESYKDALSVYLVTLPENAEKNRGYYQGHYDIALYPGRNAEIRLDLCLQPDEASLKFVEAAYDFDENEDQGGRNE